MKAEYLIIKIKVKSNVCYKLIAWGYAVAMLVQMQAMFGSLGVYQLIAKNIMIMKNMHAQANEKRVVKMKM